jgi:subtilisin family serine protease
VLSGSPYAVTVLTQPTGPSQTCTASNGTGTVGSGNVTSVVVSCATNSYTIGGTITGLTGSGLVLRNNGGNDLPVAAGATSFTFSAPVASGSTYAATVLTQPANQTCSLSNRTGTVVSSNVTSVGVICGGAPFTIGTLGDPLATQQWHLKNTGQTAFATNGGVAGFDVNVEPVYSTLGFTGLGVIVAVLDSGLQIAHEDLAVNVGGGGSWNFINGTTDPTNTTIDPSFNGREADHGTSVGGLIAMARNTVGGIGVAPSARLKGFNVLKSQTTANFVAALGGSASSPTSSDVSVFNQSYGLELTSDSQINSTIAAQYLAGVTNLRNGKGAIYVKSAGNSFGRDGSGGVLPGCSAADAAGVSCENANHDPENAIPYQIVVSALNAAGVKSSYSTAGSAIWVSAPGGEFGDDAPAMITTDQSGCTDGRSRTNAGSTPFDGGAAPNTQCNYRNTFNGTSSAAPVTAGVAALLLQANPDLTWRDVKHILASTARRVDAFRPALTVLLSNGLYVAERAWTTNVAGYRFHNWYGFGLIDAAAAVAMARNNYVPLAPLAVSPTLATPALGLAIPDNSVTGVTSSLTVPAGSVQVVEAVQITVSATHAASGDLGIELVSPSGTRSVLKNIRDRFGVSDDLNGMVLLSNAFYGEPAVGTWTLKVVDGFVAEVGTLTRWSIKIFGR